MGEVCFGAPAKFAVGYRSRFAAGDRSRFALVLRLRFAFRHRSRSAVDHRARYAIAIVITVITHTAVRVSLRLYSLDLLLVTVINLLID